MSEQRVRTGHNGSDPYHVREELFVLVHEASVHHRNNAILTLVRAIYRPIIHLPFGQIFVAIVMFARSRQILSGFLKRLNNLFK